MTLDTFLQIAVFAFAMLYTPGPNNVMLANSGARFGFRASVPHLLGVSLGFAMMLFAVALGLGEIFERSTLFRETLRWVGVAVMLWIGWKIATAGRAEGEAPRRPWRFSQAAGFQWINPKAWSICIGIAASFVTGDAPVVEALGCALVFAVIGTSSGAAWTLFGTGIRRFLSTEGRLRAFNLTMGALIALCALMLILE